MGHLTIAEEEIRQTGEQSKAPHSSNLPLCFSAWLHFVFMQLQDSSLLVDYKLQK